MRAWLPRGSRSVLESTTKNETFAPVERTESINTVLAIAAAEDLKAENVDVNTAFLYGEVEEEIYMDQPDGFGDERSPTKKCLL